MKLNFQNRLACEEKRQRTGAVQDTAVFTMASNPREASWTAPALWRFGLAVVFGVLVFSQSVFAADTAADFAAANKFYAEGKFSEAATAYDKIIQTGAQSPALLALITSHQDEFLRILNEPVSAAGGAMDEDDGDEEDDEGDEEGDAGGACARGRAHGAPLA